MTLKTTAMCAAIAGLVGAVAIPVGAQGGAKPGPQSKAAQELVARAMALAKDDLVNEARIACTESGPAREPDRRAMQPVEPLKVFDNLYYVGFEQIGTWTLDTGDGLILFDTLNTPLEARDVLIPGLKKLGLDPANIKYVVLSHGHFDHFGGAPYLQERYGMPVLMTAADWDLIARPPAANATEAQRNRPKPSRDREIADGQRLTVGNTTITFGHMPGHTPGTVAMTFQVRDKGVPRTVLFTGGALQVPNKDSLRAFEHIMNDYFKAQKPEMVFNSHPLTMNDGLAMMRQIRQNPNGPNPYVMGQERMARYMDIMLLCRKAWVVEKDPSAM